jgi:NAD(P)-dependent dehydrogenase (short-subunit alcohol dehydrogenase family)
VLENRDMFDKVILITGSTSGIGKATAMALAKLGASVVLVGRCNSRGENAAAEIERESGNHRIQFFSADLSVQYQIRQLAERFITRFDRLDVLINNVGGLYGQRMETVDGIETTFAINHLCPFLLTRLLLPMLRMSAPSRIVNVNSEGHRFAQEVNFNDLQSKRWKRGFLIYSQAKLANLMFTYDLAERLAGERIVVNAVHPGMVETQLVRGFLTQRIFSKAKVVSTAGAFLLMKMAKLFYEFDDLEIAAQACVYLATAPELEGLTGKYFNKDKQMVTSSSASHDKVAAQRLWRVSSELTGCDERCF